MLGAAAISLVVSACGGAAAEPDVALQSTSTSTPATVLLDPAFAGDAFDATCAVLDESSVADPAEAVREVYDALASIGGDDAAATTLRLAIDDGCPEWSDAVDLMLGG